MLFQFRITHSEFLIYKKKVSLSTEIKAFGTYTAEVKFLAGVSEKITVEVIEG